MSVRYKAKRRFRYYVQRGVCQRCGERNAVSCFLPEPSRISHAKGMMLFERKPDELLCAEHARQAGYCSCCGDFWAGIDSFDFLHPGLCDNCHDQIKADFYDGDGEEEPDLEDHWE